MSTHCNYLFMVFIHACGCFTWNIIFRFLEILKLRHLPAEVSGWCRGGGLGCIGHSICNIARNCYPVWPPELWPRHKVASNINCIYWRYVDCDYFWWQVFNNRVFQFWLWYCFLIHNIFILGKSAYQCLCTYKICLYIWI